MHVTQAWVEVQERSQDTEWCPLINALPFLANNALLVAALFGDGHTVGFHPVVPVRGLLPDTSLQVRESFERGRTQAGGALVSSWISWQEASTIHWQEIEALPERRLLRHPLGGGVAYVGPRRRKEWPGL